MPFIYPYRNEMHNCSHHCYGRMKQTANKYGTTRAKMSTVMNEGVKMRCKAVTTNFLKLLGLIIELRTFIL